MDIIAWGDTVMEGDFLTLPHPRAKERAFVLIPLKEVEPNFVFPDGTTIDQALEEMNRLISSVSSLDQRMNEVEASLDAISTITETIEAFGPFFTRVARQVFGAGVDLDAGQDSL